MYVVVIGCGRLGSELARTASREGHSVVAVDRDPTALQALSGEPFGGFCIEGDAAEPAVLRRAEIARADLLVAATEDDNLNLMAAQVARAHFGVPRVIARVFDPRRHAIYRELGLETVCPTTLAAEAFFRRVEELQEELAPR